LVAYTYNPTYLGSYNQKDRGLRPAHADSSRDSPISISKIAAAKWTGDAAQAVEHLLCKHEAVSSNSVP
jgi:hypothetical protein